LGDDKKAHYRREGWGKEKKPWQNYRLRTKRGRERMAQLSSQPIESLRIEELHELAVLKDEFDSPAAAKPLLELLVRQPRNSFYKAALLYGRILLDEDNDRGLDYLMQAARGDINLVEECARIGGNYQFRKHGEEIAENWWEDMMRILERQTGEAS
jgi:hypothetical protein